MDKTSYIVLAICCILLFAWEPLSKKVFSNQENPDISQNAEQQDVVSSTSTNTIAITQTNTSVVTPEINGNESAEEQIPSLSSVETPLSAGEPVQSAPVEEQIFVLETAEANYEFSSLYGGLTRVILNNHPRIITCSDSGEIASTNKIVLNRQNPYAVLGLENLRDLGATQGFQGILDEENRSITFWKQLDNGLQLAQQFTISTNDFQLTGRVQIKNTSTSAPAKVNSTRRSIGAISVNQPHEQDIDLRLYYMEGTDFKKIQAGWFDNKTLGCIPGTPRPQFYTNGSQYVWGGVANRFFSIIVEPKTNPGGLVAVRKEFRFPNDPKNRPHHLIQAAFYYPERILDPGESVVRDFDIYAGPKSYNILQELPHEKHRVADFGFFGFFSKGLHSAMNGFHSLGLSYALSILLITFIIKMLFWPLTHASTKSMKRMSKLQPQMKEIQDKYKEEPQKMQQKLMAFMKENKVNPMGGCIPILLQMPVFIGFFYMIRTAVELRGASFLWACDLSESDTIAHVMGFPINPMPILMGVTMLIQARLTPPAAGVDPMQANMMRYMPLMFVAFLYNFSSALTMYWTFQNILSIIQTKLTKIDESKLVALKPTTTNPVAPKKKKPRRPKNWMEAKQMAMKSSKNKKKK